VIPSTGRTGAVLLAQRYVANMEAGRKLQNRQAVLLVDRGRGECLRRPPPAQQGGLEQLVHQPAALQSSIPLHNQGEPTGKDKKDNWLQVPYMKSARHIPC